MRSRLLRSKLFLQLQEKNRSSLAKSSSGKEIWLIVCAYR